MYQIFRFELKDFDNYVCYDINKEKLVKIVRILLS